MATQIQVRRDTAANWTSANPTLATGEIGFENDQNKFKIGDGSTAYTSLAYAGGSEIGNTLANLNTITSETGQNISITADGGIMTLGVDNATHSTLAKNGDGTTKTTVGYVVSTNPAFPVNGAGFGTPVNMNVQDGNGFTFNAADAELGTVQNLANGDIARIIYPANGAGSNVMKYIAANTNIKFGTMSGSTATPFDGTFGGTNTEYNPTNASVLVIEVTGYNSNAYVTSWTSTET
jgi:hypothetical protein